MAIALRGTPTTASRTTAGALAVNVPTGTVAGDILIFNITCTSNSGSISTPSGLTLIESKNDSASGGTAASFRRVCNGSEGSSYSFTLTGGGGSGTGRAYSGADNTSPINGHSAFNKTGSTNATATTITTNVDGCTLIFVSDSAAAAAFTTPSGFGNQALVNPGGGTGSAVSSDKAQSSQGATGSITGTWGGSGNNWTSVIALAPAPTYTGAATRSETLTFTAAGVRTTFGAAALAETLAFTAAGTRTVLGEAHLTATMTITAAGTRTTFAAADMELTDTITADGTRTATALADFPLVFAITAAGARGQVGAAELAETLTITATGHITEFGAATLPLTLTFAASGNVLLVFPAGHTGTLTVPAEGDAVRAHTGHVLTSGRGRLTHPGGGQLTETTRA